MCKQSIFGSKNLVKYCKVSKFITNRVYLLCMSIIVMLSKLIIGVFLYLYMGFRLKLHKGECVLISEPRSVVSWPSLHKTTDCRAICARELPSDFYHADQPTTRQTNNRYAKFKSNLVWVGKNEWNKARKVPASMVDSPQKRVVWCGRDPACTGSLFCGNIKVTYWTSK